MDAGYRIAALELLGKLLLFLAIVLLCTNDAVAQTDSLLKKAETAYAKNNYKEARALYKTACDKGITEACTAYGADLYNGLGGPRDYDAAQTIFSQTCEKKDARGCNGLGLMFLNGLGVSKDETKAYKLFEHGCEIGGTRACNSLGVMYYNGQVVSQNKAQAAHYYDLACQRGDAFSGCVNLGMMLANGEGVSADPVRAQTLYDLGCQAGSGSGCYSLGWMWLKGEGGARDEEKARSLFTDACYKNNYGSGCSQLASMIYKDDKMKNNLLAARVLNKRACGLKDPQGCYNYAVMQELGQGGEKSRVEAKQYYQKACDAEYARGCFSLGLLEEDRQQQVSLFEQACKGGYEEACKRLAETLKAEKKQLEAQQKKLKREIEESEQELTEAKREMERADKKVEESDREMDQLEKELAEIQRERELIKKFHEAELAKDAGKFERARILYEEACNGGDAMSCSELGEMLLKGKGGPKDEEQAREVFERSCRGEYIGGCHFFGLMLHRGQGGPQDDDGARKAFEQACDGGIADGCLYAGVMFEKGGGGQKNTLRARDYYKQACDSGKTEGCSRYSKFAQEKNVNTSVSAAPKGCSTNDYIVISKQDQTVFKNKGIRVGVIPGSDKFWFFKKDYKRLEKIFPDAKFSRSKMPSYQLPLALNKGIIDITVTSCKQLKENNEKFFSLFEGLNIWVLNDDGLLRPTTLSEY